MPVDQDPSEGKFKHLIEVLSLHPELKFAGDIARALASLDRIPSRVEIDGEQVQPQFAGKVLLLPRGQHLVTLTR